MINKISEFTDLTPTNFSAELDRGLIDRDPSQLLTFSTLFDLAVDPLDQVDVWWRVGPLQDQRSMRAH